jgi:hypothetical protein
VTYDSFAGVLQMLLYLQNILIFLLKFSEGSFVPKDLLLNFFCSAIFLFFDQLVPHTDQAV